MHNFVESGINKLKIAAKFSAPAILTLSTLSCLPETEKNPAAKLAHDLKTPGRVIQVIEGSVLIPRNINRRASPEDERFDNFISYNRNEVALNPIVLKIGSEHWLTYNDTLGARVFIPWNDKTQVLIHNESATRNINGSDCRIVRTEKKEAPQCEPLEDQSPIISIGTSITPQQF